MCIRDRYMGIILALCVYISSSSNRRTHNSVWEQMRLLITAVLAAIATVTLGDNMNCLRVIGDNFFTIKAASRSEDYNISLADKYPQGAYIYFSICNYAKTNTQCAPERKAFAFLQINNTVDTPRSPEVNQSDTQKNENAQNNNTPSSCYPLTSEETADDRVGFSLIDGEDPSLGINIDFPPGDPIPNVNYKRFTLTIECNRQGTGHLTVHEYKLESEVLRIRTSSLNGCPHVSVNALWQFVDDYKFIFALVGLVMGAFLCFFGTRAQHITIFTFSFLIAFFLLMMILLWIFYAQTSVGVESSNLGKWVVCIVCIAVSAIAGVFAVKYMDLGFFSLGVALGYFGAGILYTPILSRINVGNPTTVFWVLFILLSIVGGFLTYKFKDLILMITTSCVGAYMFIRAVAALLGGFPNEFEIGNRLKNKEMDGIPGSVYIYLFLMIVLALGSFYYQFRDKQARTALLEEGDTNYAKLNQAQKGNGW
eukprot:TRINITY_DN854_c0_g1_i1.p1 TRINITY_DN854_c0_g1~~TRINITY_DN854_c0_g1_i1.p1  ORF type:complete len:501 (+),score=111.45 TRINITY_DN854_c0_g1_i1:62-1504(+)